MEREDAINKAFEMIAIGGDAKGMAYEALELAEKGQFEEADKLVKDSEQSLLEAHHIQTDLISRTARGEDIPIDMLFVHGQDHLMCAIEAQSLIKHLIGLSKRIAELEAKLA